MNKKKHTVQAILTIGVIIVGLYMLFSYDWGTAPAVSGLGFLLAGLALWVPHCPIMNFLFGGKTCGHCQTDKKQEEE